MKSVAVLACVLGFLSSCARGERVYSNSWAVEVVGGDSAAEELATKHGFTNLGKVGSLEGVYHFRHEPTPLRGRRSVEHAGLAGEASVVSLEQQEVKVRAKRGGGVEYSPPTDLKWDSQWYLHRSSGHHMNVERAWEQDIIGRGSVVSILDDGIEYTHDDLRHSYDPEASYDFNDHDSDPIPRYEPTNENKHGTRCAGEVAANRDGKCGVGAAYGGRVGGVRMLDGDVTDVVEASSLSLNPQHIDIYSSSWGPSDDGTTVDGPGRLAQKAFLDGVTKGRGGLGSLFVWAAGNGGRMQDSCNCDGYAVSPHTISVGSASERDNMPWYAERCSSTLAATYSSGGAGEKQIVTTDLHNLCTPHHTGTSAAAPLAAGILALALEANRNLTWRDMQYCVVYSSNPAFPHDDGWESNAAGLRVSHRYGFGIIDATALVNRARHWITVPPRESCVFNVSLDDSNVATSSHPLSVSIHTPGCTLVYLEHAQAIATISVNGNGIRGAVKIDLTSPQGTESTLLSYRDHDHHHNGFHRWPFMTVHSWAEDPRGNWEFSVSVKSGTEATVESLSLVLHGTSTIPDAVHRIPRECHEQCEGRCSRAGATFCDQCRSVRVASTLECVTSCPEGTYQHLHMCLECPQLCQSCEDAQTCSKCVSGAVKLENSLCSDSCPDQTFIAEDDSCRACHHSCLQCNGPGEQSCTACPGQWELSAEGACVVRETCPEGSYMDHRVLECRSCHHSCAECSGKESDSCTACYPNFALKDGKCVGDVRELRACSPGQYFDDKQSTCLPCSQGCANCTDEITCTACDDRHFMATVRVRESEEVVQSCASQCQKGFFGDAESGSCQPCPSSCDDCTALNNCTACTFNLSLPQEGRCAQPCHDGSYFNFTSEDCQPCMPNCAACLTGNACLQCESEFFITPSHGCVSACPAHTVAKLRDRVCLDARCHESCLTCFGPEVDQCISCDTSIAMFHENTCLNACPNHTYSNETVCLHCHDSCATCAGPDESDCLTCPPSSFMDHHECISQCPPGSFPSPEKECLACPLHCWSCSSTTTGCQSCQEGFILLSSNLSCISHCPAAGHAMIDGVCHPCQDHCQTCSSLTSCTACSRGYSYYSPNKSCMSECPEGYYSSSAGVCTECKFPCNSCTGPGQCLVCARDHAMEGSSGECLACCNPDKPDQVECCDCDANERECILTEPHYSTANNGGGGRGGGASTRYIVGALAISLVVAAVVSVLAMIGYKCYYRHRVTRRYDVLPAVDKLELVDDSGSEAELYTVEMDG